MRWSVQYKDEGGRMKDEKMRGVHVLRGSIGAASDVALAVSQAGQGLQAIRFFHPSAFIPHPCSSVFHPFYLIRV